MDLWTIISKLLASGTFDSTLIALIVLIALWYLKTNIDNNQKGLNKLYDEINSKLHKMEESIEQCRTTLKDIEDNRKSNHEKNIEDIHKIELKLTAIETELKNIVRILDKLEV